VDETIAQELVERALGYAFFSVETCDKELSSPVERCGRFVENRVIGLEDMGHPGG
jgi:hypothetical protein